MRGGRRFLWSLFAVFAAIVLAPLIWITQLINESVAEEQLARSEWNRWKGMQIAIERMDSMVSKLLTQESTRPIADYRDDTLLRPPSRVFRLFFEVSEDYGFRSPQLVTGENDLTLEELKRAAQLLAQIEGTSDYFDMLRSLAPRIVRQRAPDGTFMKPSVQMGRMEGLFFEHPVHGTPELLFLRAMRENQTTILQGIWCDWPWLQSELGSSVVDLFPAAHFRTPLDPGRSELQGHLASIPVTFEPVRMTPPPPATSPASSALLLAWIAVPTAILSLGFVVYRTFVMGERRRQFAAATTHELRSPLTTFCLYTEMLADGLITDEKTQREYLDSLRNESLRLRRVVENVLRLARLERESLPKRPPLQPLSELVRPMLERLRARAASGGKQLVVVDVLACSRLIAIEREALETILVNLVDNSCKYGHPADNDDLELWVRERGRRVEIHFRDYGPGLDEQRGFRPFRAFERGRDVGGSGAGLGLALARQLARTFGGGLVHSKRREQGAHFIVRLPSPRPSATDRTALAARPRVADPRSGSHPLPS